MSVALGSSFLFAVILRLPTRFAGLYVGQEPVKIVGLARSVTDSCLVLFCPLLRLVPALEIVRLVKSAGGHLALAVFSRLAAFRFPILRRARRYQSTK